jgi:hypothetical protein
MRVTGGVQHNRSGARAVVHLNTTLQDRPSNAARHRIVTDVLTPAEARSLAAELEAAASHAERTLGAATSPPEPTLFGDGW